MEKLTRRQQEVLETIIRMMQENEYPPTLKELADALGASSRNTAVKHLTVLDRKGYIRWEKNIARGIKILEHMGLLDGEEEQSLPLVGLVTAGLPMLAEENIERYVPAPKHLLRARGRHFMLRVQGESMKNAGILDEDLVVVRSQSAADVGDIVVALLDDKATVKRLALKKGKRYLKAENPEFPDIHPDGEWTVQGKVVALMRENVE
jgi:repressor LexA